MLMFIINSLFMIILLLIFVVVSSHSTSSVSIQTYASSVNSTHPVFNTSTTTITATNLINQKDKNISTLEFEITAQIKALIAERVDKNKTNSAMAIGFVDPNGTQFYGYGPISNTSNAMIDENTLFAIGSNTKVFTFNSFDRYG